MIDVRVQAGDFEPGRQLRRLEELGAGAVSSATLAAAADLDVTRIAIEHYPALAKNELGRIAAEAEARFGLVGVILIHRHGVLAPGDRVAFAAASAPEPERALGACAFLVEALRTQAPFWRQETREDGSTRWR